MSVNSLVPLVSIGEAVSVSLSNWAVLSVGFGAEILEGGDEELAPSSPLIHHNQKGTARLRLRS